MKHARLILAMLLISLLASFIPAKAQTSTNPQVWGCNTNCTNVANWNNWSWLARDPAPTYVAATSGIGSTVATGTPPSCRNFWGSVTRRTSDSVKAQLAATPSVNVCVGGRRSTSEDTTLPASLVFGNLTPQPTPVDCVVSGWGEWTVTDPGQCRNRLVTQTQARSRTIVTPASNGGAACPALTETRTVSQACSLSPTCWPHSADFLPEREGVFAKAQWGFVQTAGKYFFKSVWFCATPDGPRKQVWASTLMATMTRAQQEANGGRYDEAVAADTCESECEIVSGALKDELDAFGAQWTVEQLGTLP